MEKGSSTETGLTLGAYLKSVRLQRRITVEQAAVELHVASAIVRDVEADDFSSFSARVYFLGFVESYAAFLDAPPEELQPRLKKAGVHFISKIQEYENVVAAERDYANGREIMGRLWNKTISRKRKVQFIVLVSGLSTLAFLLLAAGAAFFLFKGHLSSSSILAGRRSGKSENFVIKEKVSKIKFHSGDTLTVMLGSKSYKIRVVRKSSLLWSLIPSDPSFLQSSDPSYPLRHTVLVELFFKHPYDLRLYFTPEVQKRRYIELLIQKVGNGGAVSSAPAQAPDLTPTGIKFNAPPVLILKSMRPVTLTVTVSFRGHLFFHYETDGQVELPGKTFEDDSQVSFNFYHRAVIWSSNAGKTQIRIGDQRIGDQYISLGRIGEVVAGELIWLPSEDGGLKLMYRRLQ